MLSIHQFNGLGGTIATRETLLEIRTNAIKDGNDEIVSRIDDLLFLYPTAKKFEIELDDYVIEPVPESFLNGLDYEPFQEEGAGLGRVSPTEVYDMITAKVIEMITEANLPGYKKKWEAKQYGKGYTIPFNFVTKKRYRGINLVMLTELEPIENPFFLTFKQVNELKGKVKKGAKGYEVIYFTKIWKTEDRPKNLKFSSYDKAKVETFRTENSIENDLGVIPMLKYYHVYNGADIEGIDFKLDSFKIGFIDNEKPSTEANKMPIPEAILKNYPAPQPKLQFGGDKAFHQGGGVGLIQMPYITDFETVQDYYRTLFHEYSHSTGSPKRLNRKLGNKFGSKEYAFEELVAELGAIFLIAEAGIIWHNNTNHAAYLKSWNSVLSQIKDDNKFIMKASTAAQKVADFVLQFDENGNPLYFKDLKDSTFAKKQAIKEQFAKAGAKASTKNQTLKQKFFEFLKDEKNNNFVDEKNNISVAKNSPKFYKFTQRVREHISDSKELIITDPKNYQNIYNEYQKFILKSIKTLTPVDKVSKYKVGDSVAIDTFEAKVLSFKLNRKKEFVYKCKYVIPPASGSSIFEANESDLHLYKKPKPVAKRTEKTKVNTVIAYALLDNITGEVMATKKTISEIIDFAHKNDSGKFSDLELLVYEIQSVGGKNKMTNKVVVELPKKTVSNEQKKTKEVAIQSKLDKQINIIYRRNLKNLRAFYSNNVFKNVSKDKIEKDRLKAYKDAKKEVEQKSIIKPVSNGQRKTKEIAKKPVTKPNVKPKTVKKQAVTPIAKVQKKTKEVDFLQKYGVEAKELVQQANHFKNVNFVTVYGYLTDKQKKNAIENGTATENEFIKDFVIESVNQKLSLTNKIMPNNNLVLSFDLDTIETAIAPKINKTGVDSLLTIAGKDDLRPIMMGAFVDNGNLVATDAHKLVIIKAPEQVKNNGKVLNLHLKTQPKYSDLISQEDGKLTTRYPNYKAVIPNHKQKGKTIAVRELMNYCQTLIALAKPMYKGFIAYFALSDGKEYKTYYNPKFLLDTLTVLEANGAKQVTLKVGSRYSTALIINSDNGNLGLMMPIHSPYYSNDNSYIINDYLPILQTPEEFEGLKGAFPTDLFSNEKKNDNQSLLEGLKVPIFNTPAPEKIGVPEYEIKKPNVPININSLAYRRQNRNATTHEYYEIDNPNVADFLGKIEKKKKESVAITIAGGQGSGKTSFVFQLINEFAKRYKVGHASIEEHPESALYEDKAQRFWNEHAKATVDSPEINTIDDIHKLILRNDVIVIDSFSKLLSMDRKITLDETFRKKYDGKLFIIIYQLTTNGSMRGGSASQFDGDVILFVEKFPDFNDNYVYADKNRYQTANIEELRYNIATAQLVALEEPEEQIQFTEEIERI